MLENDADFTSQACTTPTLWINAAHVSANTNIIVRICTMDRNHTYDASTGNEFGTAALRADSSGIDTGTANHKYRGKPAGGSYSGYAAVTGSFGSGANTWVTLSKSIGLPTLNQGSTKLQFASKDMAGN